MHLDIITPDKNVYSGEVISVQLPGVEGKFQVLKNHAPLIATLALGKVKVVDVAKETTFFELTGGVVEVLNNKVTVLAEKA